MLDVKENVYKDLEELRIRYDKLKVFITDEKSSFESLLEVQKSLIIIQANMMQAYINTLELRLENWE